MVHAIPVSPYPHEETLEFYERKEKEMKTRKEQNGESSIL